MNKDKLKALRFFHEFTQQQMADHLGLSQSTITAVEDGTRSITPFIRGRVALKFKIDDAFNDYYENYQRTTN